MMVDTHGPSPGISDRLRRNPPSIAENHVRMKFDCNGSVSIFLRLQTGDKYILFVELANEKYISCNRSTRLCLTDNPPWNRRPWGNHYYRSTVRKGSRVAMKPPKLIVFDMDGVIIDVSGSYRETVRKTARLFFEGAKGFEKMPDPLFSLADLTRLKQTGGLNNDWDLTAQVIHLLFALVKASGNQSLSDDSPRHEEAIQGYDVSGVADFLKITSSPLMNLWNRYGRRKEHFVADCFKGDVNTGNVIKRIFQEIYLGRSLFTETYGLDSKFHREEGLINHERLLMDKTILEALADKHILAIATGRPLTEANYPLDHFAIRKYFKQVITLDDCSREEERIFKERGERISVHKPNPFMLDLLPRLIGKSFHGCYYLGDMPDDMQAARASQTGYRGVGVILSSPDPENLRKELLQAGAHYIINDYIDLFGIIA